MSTTAHAITLPVVRSTTSFKREAIVTEVARTEVDGTLVALVVGLGLWLAVAVAVLTTLTGLSPIVHPQGDNPEIVVVGRL